MVLLSGVFRPIRDDVMPLLETGEIPSNQGLRFPEATKQESDPRLWVLDGVIIFTYKDVAATHHHSRLREPSI